MIKQRRQCGQVRCRKRTEQIHIIFESFVGDLRARGYAAEVVALYGRVTAHFERWLAQRHITSPHICEAQVQAFLNRHLPRCQCPGPTRRSYSVCRAGLSCLVHFLRREGFIRARQEDAAPLKAADRLLVEFDQHLDRVQGLSPLTRRTRSRYAREFLTFHFGPRKVQLRGLKAGDLLRFVNTRSRRLKRTSLRALVVGLRSFLRFLEFGGRVAQGLASALPSPACPLAQPPLEILDDRTRRRFLGCFDRNTPIGRRDYAIALCFAELALRANEVGNLTLDDVNWRTLTLRLKETKQRRERMLPLPPGVARALVAYLQRARPKVGHRRLFVSFWAPKGRPLSIDGVRHVIGRAFARCGIPGTGPHVLRRSWATQAHRRGLGLKLIGDLLGHRSLETTAPYAKVHFEELRQAALPWPNRKP